MRKLPSFVSLATVLILALGTMAPAALAQTPQSCYCITPKTAGGTAAGGGTVTIKWGSGDPATGGATATVNTTAGQTPQQIAQSLRDQLDAQLPHTVGPVAVDPATGRAVFCVDGKKPNLFGYSETDRGIKKITYQRVRPNSWFLRNVAGAWVASVAEGGAVGFDVEVLNHDGTLSTVTAEVSTFAGEAGSNVTERLVEELYAIGLEASQGEWDFGGEEGYQPALFLEPGIYAGISSMGVFSEDDGLFGLRIAASDERGEPLADFDNNHRFDNQDLVGFAAAFSSADPGADLDHNGWVDQADLVLFLGWVALDAARFGPPAVETAPLRLAPVD